MPSIEQFPITEPDRMMAKREGVTVADEEARLALKSAPPVLAAKPEPAPAREPPLQPAVTAADARRVQNPIPTARVDKNLFTGISDAELDALAAATDGCEAVGGIAVIVGLRRALRVEFMAGKSGAAYGPTVVIQSDIARFAQTSLATVKRWIPRLESAGIIEVESRKKPTGENYPCIYKMRFPVGEIRRKGERSPLAQYEPRGGLNMSGGVGSSTSKPVSYLRRDSEETVETLSLSAAPSDGAEAGTTVSAKENAAPRPRNPLFDALAAATGCNPLEMTEPAARACAVALKAIRKVAPDLMPAEIKRRADSYRRKHPDWSLTPNALAKHWPSLGESAGTTATDWNRNPLYK